jgi:hypothetical protein
VLTIIAIPLVALSPRQRSSGRLLLAFLAYFSFFNLQRLAENWLATGVTPMWLTSFWYQILILGMVYLGAAPRESLAAAGDRKALRPRSSPTVLVRHLIPGRISDTEHRGNQRFGCDRQWLIPPCDHAHRDPAITTARVTTATIIVASALICGEPPCARSNRSPSAASSSRDPDEAGDDQVIEREREGQQPPREQGGGDQRERDRR